MMALRIRPSPGAILRSPIRWLSLFGPPTSMVSLITDAPADVPAIDVRLTCRPTLKRTPPVGAVYRALAGRWSPAGGVASNLSIPADAIGDTAQGANQEVGLLFGVVQHEGRSDGVLDPKRRQKRLRLKTSGPHGDAFLVQCLGHYSGVQALDGETDDRYAVGGLSENSHERHLSKSGPCVQAALIGRDGRQPQVCPIIESRAPRLHLAEGWPTLEGPPILWPEPA